MTTPVFEKKVVTTINTQYQGVKSGIVVGQLDGSEQAYIGGKKVSMEEYRAFALMSDAEKKKNGYYLRKTTTYVNEETTFGKEGNKISVVSRDVTVSVNDGELRIVESSDPETAKNNNAKYVPIATSTTDSTAEKTTDTTDDTSDIEIGQDTSGVSALGDGDTPAIVEAVTGGGNNVTGGGGNNTAPPTGEKPKGGTKVPPITIQHSECGHLTFGDEKKNSNRPRDVGLYGGDSQKLRLFRDGGFELCSSESQGVNQKSGSSILQVCDNAPLTMNSEGDIFIRAKNKLVLRADHIEIESTHGSTEGVVIKAKHDINIRADNNIIMTSDNITLDAKERVLTHSEGWTVLIGQYVRIHEPQTKICPAFLEEYIDGQIKTLKG